ncbi:MAG: hypothetical protein GPJ51_11710 [Candidatus Heimdallarchaeota archaeon]|nr:hypothetical protein [Candidatus Heimdallarchaeota archaeon]
MKETIFKYISTDEIISVLSTTSKTVKKKPKDDLQKLLFKELKEKKISSTKIRNFWSKALKNQFFEEFQRVYLFTPVTKYDTSTKLKKELTSKSKKLKEESDLKFSNSYISKLSSSPLHFVYMFGFKELQDQNDLMKLPLDSLMFLSILPELGVAICPACEKTKKHKFIVNLLKATFTNVTELKVNALLLRKYATQETITKLSIATPQEIAGFAGLDVIEFKGPNVMLGLSGLKRRHDANVEVITRVGPFKEIESGSIMLKCGKGIHFKKYAGLISLLNTLKIG